MFYAGVWFDKSKNPVKWFAGLGLEDKAPWTTWVFNPFASEAVYTRNFFSDRMSDSV